MKPSGVITITTDFGHKGPFAGVMKGVILTRFPQATIDGPDFEERVADYYERFDVALSEDIPMLVQQHAGQRSPFARQGRYSYLEPSVAAFADWYAGRLLSVS